MNSDSSVCIYCKHGCQNYIEYAQTYVQRLNEIKFSEDWADAKYSANIIIEYKLTHILYQ